MKTPARRNAAVVASTTTCCSVTNAGKPNSLRSDTASEAGSSPAVYTTQRAVIPFNQSPQFNKPSTVPTCSTPTSLHNSTSILQFQRAAHQPVSTIQQALTLQAAPPEYHRLRIAGYDPLTTSPGGGGPPGR
uniref:Uncharacterized protein n=1 Tax=Haemonchus contortus TaxID=6289 RepID=A0A7I4Z2A7_HAECO